MCYPQKIPIPITVLYVITVVNLTVLLNLTLVEANVVVLTQKNHTVEEGILDLPAQFGPPVPDTGVWGHLVYAEPHDACSKIKPPPKDTDNTTGIGNQWIALIKRNGCNFDTKVLNAQNQGYIAAIVHNVESDKLIAMGGKGNASKVDIPSVFIGAADAQYLFVSFNKNIHYTIVVDTRHNFLDTGTVKMIFAIFAIVIGSCFITMIVFAIVKWVRDFRRRRRSRLSKQHLKKLPVKKFKKGDSYDVCAICLDEYEEGNKLRILPCNHAYHQKCIDPWLTKNKKTCPICKRKVIPGRSSDDSSSDSDSYDGTTTGPEASGESEPLLGASGRTSSSRTSGNTFDNSAGIPERFRTYRLSSSDFDEEGESSSDNDSLVPVTSRYQSSVEVHSEPDYRRNRMARPPRRIGRLGAPRYALVDEVPKESNASENVTGRSANLPKPERRAWEYGISPPDDDNSVARVSGLLVAVGEDQVDGGQSGRLDDHIESHLESPSTSRKNPAEIKKNINPELAATVLKQLTETPESHHNKKKKSKSSRKSPSTRSIDSVGSKSAASGGGNQSDDSNIRIDGEIAANEDSFTGNTAEKNKNEVGCNNEPESKADTDSIGSKTGISATNSGGDSSGSENNTKLSLGNHSSDGGAMAGVGADAGGAVCGGGSDSAPLLEEPEVEVVSMRRSGNSRKKPKKRRKVDKNA